MSIFINLAVIFWSLFPSLLVYSDNQDEPLKVQLTQLVANSDLLIDDNSDGVPDGFSYNANTTDISLTNGIAKFTATARYGGFSSPLVVTIGVEYYVFANIKVSSTPDIVGLNTPLPTRHSGSDNFELISNVFTATDNRRISVLDIRTSGFTPIEVDYMGAINITDLVSRGLLPGDLSDLEYKTLLDSILNEIGGTFQEDYFYSESLTDNYNWFRSGFVSESGERDFLDYLGFFVWLSCPYLFAFVLYKLLKGVLYG